MTIKNAAIADTHYDLLDVYDTALDKSPLIKSMKSQYDAYSYNTDISGSAFYPEINLVSKLDRKYEFDDQWQHQKDVNQVDLGLSLSQVLFDYSLYHFNEVSESLVKSANQALQFNEQQFIFNVAKSYFQVLLAKSNIDVAKKQLEATRSMLKQSKAQNILGQTNISVLKQIEARVYNAEAELIRTENHAQALQYQLAVFTGLDDNSRLKPLKDTIPIFRPVPNDKNEWVEIALNNNNRLSQLRYQANASRKAIDVCKGTFWPKVSLNASYHYLVSPIYYPGFGAGFFDQQQSQGNNFNNIHSSAKCIQQGSNQIKPAKYNRGWVQLKGQQMQVASVGVTFSWNIFNGGTDDAAIKQASEKFVDSSYQLRQSKREIIQNIKNSYLKVITSIQKIKAFREAKLQSDIAYYMLYEQHKLGSTPINEVLRQMQITYENDYKVYKAQFNYIINILKLKKIAGTLSRDDLVELNYWLDSQG